MCIHTYMYKLMCVCIYIYIYIYIYTYTCRARLSLLAPPRRPHARALMSSKVINSFARTY